MLNNNDSIRFVFFGTPELAVLALEVLKKEGLIPRLVVTQPDKPVGRKHTLTPPPVKVWATSEHIPVLQPEKLNDSVFLETLQKNAYDLFVVFAYGKIIPLSLLSIPLHGALNLHPSLLPKLRGPSPIESSILNDDKDTGVSIIKMDQEMDHGPIVLSKQIHVTPWPPTKQDLSLKLVTEGALLLAEAIITTVNGTAVYTEQDHSQATFCNKITKEDGQIDPHGDAYTNYLKYQAFTPWPGIFFMHNGTRIKITNASFKDGVFVINKVIPEGKKEMDFAQLAL